MKKVLIALLFGLFVPLAWISPATAKAAPAYDVTSVPGCEGVAGLKSSGWSIIKKSRHYADTSKWKLRGFGLYYHCPQGVRADKEKVIGYSFCYTILDISPLGTLRRYDAIKWNAYLKDDAGNIVDTPTKIQDLPDDPKEGDSHCVVQNIPSMLEKWMLRKKNPRWYLSGQFDIYQYKDDHFKFITKDGYTAKYLDPRIDPDVRITSRPSLVAP